MKILYFLLPRNRERILEFCESTQAAIINFEYNFFLVLGERYEI
jgi:hypothetical protein